MDHELHTQARVRRELVHLVGSKEAVAVFQATAMALLLAVLVYSVSSVPAFAQSGLEGRITQSIRALTRIANVMIVGFVVWSGFLIAKGESAGFQKLIYSIIGLIVVNGAGLIINYFTY